MALPVKRLFDLVDERRALQGMSWTALEDASGISRSTIAKWPTRTKPPLAGTVVAVADALGIDRMLALRLGGVIESSDLPVLSARARRVLREELGEEDYTRVIGMAEGTLVRPAENGDPSSRHRPA